MLAEQQPLQQTISHETSEQHDHALARNHRSGLLEAGGPALLSMLSLQALPMAERGVCAGDRLNFGLAVEQARCEGYKAS